MRPYLMFFYALGLLLLVSYGHAEATPEQYGISIAGERSTPENVERLNGGINFNEGTTLTVIGAAVAVSKTRQGIARREGSNGKAELAVNGGTIRFNRLHNAMYAIHELKLQNAEILPPYSAVYYRRELRVEGKMVHGQDVLIASSPLQSVKVNPNLVTLFHNHPRGGNRTQLTAVIEPSSISSAVKWSSDNPVVATVDPTSGLVTAHAVGTANITAVPDANRHMSGVAVVDVQSYKPITSFDLVCPSSLEVGSTDWASLANVDPIDATDLSVTWLSSKPQVLRIDAKTGEFEALTVGTAKVTARSADGFEASCDVDVTLKKPTEMRLSPEVLQMQIGESRSLTLQFQPNDGVDKRVQWISSKEEVAGVSEGVVTARSVGVALITVTSKADPSKSFSSVVTVKEKEPTVVLPTNLTLEPASKTLRVGEIFTLTPTFEPVDVADKRMEWFSSDAGIASVQEGEVTAHAPGVAIITARSLASNEVSGRCEVTVIKDEIPTIPLEMLGVEPASYTLQEGETLPLSPVFTPNNATDKRIRWTSSADAVASVVDGHVTAHTVGEATITAISLANERLSDRCIITVTPNPQKKVRVEVLILDLTKVALTVGDSLLLQVRIMPANATNQELAWQSGNDEVVSVTSGVVKGLSVGEATITVSNHDGTVKAACDVTVHEAQVTSVVHEALAAITVYPNPFSTRLLIRHGRAVQRYELLGPAGELVLQGEAPATEELALDLAGIPSGLYLLRVWNGRERRTFKVVRQ